MSKGKPLAGNVSYSHGAFGDPVSLIKNARICIPRDLEFDTMIGRGLSGALVIPILARAFDVHFAMIRKGESCHSWRAYEGFIGARWIFVDDLVASGSTREACKDAVLGAAPESQYVGTYCYLSEYGIYPYFQNAAGQTVKQYRHAKREDRYSV